MRPIQDILKGRPWLGWLLFLATALIVFLLGMLASSIVERRAEASFAYTPEITFSRFEPRNEVWGELFPREYESYMKTADTSFRSKYNGSANVDLLEESPEMVVLWAGYPFSKGYNQGRGHYYAIEDVRRSLRHGSPVRGKPSPLPNTCWTCKSPDVPRLMNETGVAGFYAGTWDTRGHEIINHIGCADCHDAKNMNLHISRPALVEAFEARGMDINKATHQDMRSLVCAQCHVEYYFNKKMVEGVNYLVFPWKDGMVLEDIEKYYDEIGFSDWTHPLNVVYRGQLGENYVLLGLGPYVSYALGGNFIVGDSKTSLDFDNDILIWNPLVLRRFDAGANIFFGYELSAGLFFQLNAQLGLAKINPDASILPDDDRSWKNTGFGLSVGFRF